MTEKCRDVDAAVKTVKLFALLPVIVKLPVNVTSFDMVQSCIRSNVPLVSCVLLLVVVLSSLLRRPDDGDGAIVV